VARCVGGSAYGSQPAATLAPFLAARNPPYVAKTVQV
jgi:hypothetical protein